MVSHAGVSLCVLGRGPRAKMLPSLIHSQGQDRGKFGGGWPHLGELFLVTGSLSQALGARVTGRELFAFPLAPGLPPARAQGGQGHLLCLLCELLPFLRPLAFLSVRCSNTPEGPPGALLYSPHDATQILAPGPPSGLLAATGGRNNPSNPMICTGLFSRPSPSM